MDISNDIQNKYSGKAPLDAFMNLLSIASLGGVAWAIGRVWFWLIDKAFNKVEGYRIFYTENSIKYALAVLLVMAPVYFVVMALLHWKYKKDELNHESRIYKWLTYMMLFFSALTIIGALISLLYGFLNGSYTITTLLKTLTVLLIAGFIFGFYFYDLKRKSYLKRDLVTTIVAGVVVVVLVVGVVWSFFSIDTPNQTRLKQEDEKIRTALSSSYWGIISYYDANKQLPETFEFSTYLNASDKQLANRFSYNKKDNNNFEICAVFNALWNDDGSMNYSKPMASDMYNNPAWMLSHQVGKQCYQIDAQKVSAEVFK